MNFYLCIVSFMLAMLFLSVKLEWLGFVFLALTVITLLYTPVKKQANVAWEDVKKIDAPFPDAKMDAYVKGASKQAAEFLVQSPATEYNYKGAMHKTPQLAKNFFTELKELLGMK
jgi:hypothetical protein